MEKSAVLIFCNVFLLPGVGIAIALLWRLLERTDFKRRPDLARALVGVVLLLGHLIVGVYCLSRPGHAGYDWFYF